MSDDNVIPMKAGAPTPDQDERKRAFLMTVAQAYNLYVETYGYEPEALVFVLNGVTQGTQCSWHVTGASENGIRSVLALASVSVTNAACNQ